MRAKDYYRQPISALLPVVCLLLNSCMVGPDYKEPKTAIQQHWAKSSSRVQEKGKRLIFWWKGFHDPLLTQLIEQAYQHNLSLQVAGIHVLEARAKLAQSVGQFYPQQQAALGNYYYYRVGGTSLQNLLPPSFDTASLGVSASWELDFWGKYRRAIMANDAAFLASVAAYDQALVSLTADTALAYIAYRSTEKTLRITKANILVQKEGLNIARARYTAGQTSLVDVEQAQTELAKTEARLPVLYSDLQRHQDSLALLLGGPPDSILGFLKTKGSIPKPEKKVAIGIPRESLARRPDIYQSRMQAIAQGELIGATKANLYPSLSLNGTFVFSSNTIYGNSISDIFNWSSRSINAGPSFSWPILNYGQITNAVRAQDAAFQAALLEYQNTVLSAQKEIQDTISAYINSFDSVRKLTQADHSATRSLELTLIRYREGETDFTPVLDAEQQQLSVQTQLTKAEGEFPANLVRLYRALGGGWEIRCGKDMVPDAIKATMAKRTNWGTLLKQENHEPAKNTAQKVDELYHPKW